MKFNFDELCKLGEDDGRQIKPALSLSSCRCRASPLSTHRRFLEPPVSNIAVTWSRRFLLIISPLLNPAAYFAGMDSRFFLESVLPLYLAAAQISQRSVCNIAASLRRLLSASILDSWTRRFLISPLLADYRYPVTE